ncbi:FMN-binding negative transcriptional regulator [Brevibacillus sp. NRS-1366]|uniref:FMN-binding negative transcriptional regulator n=1 Tax=Brevibacillus sp. NRS-1366 TaxID=3233899 RepID=UPI003D237C74
MYVPRYYAVTEKEEMVAFMQNYPFGLIITSNEGQPVATHIPLEVEIRGEDLYLTGHIASVNPQSELLGQRDCSVLAVFHGAHTYISSSWYGHPNVPTWNYTAVHAYGQASLISSPDQARKLMKDLMQKYEQGQQKPTAWDSVPEKMMQGMLKEITCFEIKVERMEATYKLSQNRNTKDFEAIVDKLDGLGWQDREVADQMRVVRQAQTNRLFTKTSQ